MAKASPFALSIDNNGGVLVEAGDGWTFRTAPDLLIGLRTALPDPGSLPVRLWILVIIARNGVCPYTSANAGRALSAILM